MIDKCKHASNNKRNPECPFPDRAIRRDLKECWT